MNFSTYIKAVGTVIKGNRNLSFEESKDMMVHMLEQSVHGEQIAACLLGWRLKPETVTEYKGALAACDQYISYHDIPNSLELGYPYDGKVRTPYIISLIAKMLKSFDVPVVLIGDDKQPAKNGITLQELSHHIHFDTNVHYFERAEIFPNLHHLTALRNRLGLRSAFNTLEKLHGAAHSDFAITGLFHKPYLEKYAAIFGQRYKRLGLLQGNEGSPELFKKSHFYLVQKGGIEEFIVDPAYFGIQANSDFDAGSVEDNVALLENPSKNIMQLARLNAAMYLFLVNQTSSIEEGFERLDI